MSQLLFPGVCRFNLRPGITSFAAIPWSRTHFHSAVEPIQLTCDIYHPPATKKRQLEAQASGKAKDLIGKPVVLLHGFLGSKRNYRSLAKRYVSKLGVDVYVVDLRNHGESPHGVPHNYLAMVADVHEFITKHKLDNITVLGHSMGAKVAMGVALKYPALVDKMIAVDNAPTVNKLGPEFKRYFAAMKYVEWLKIEWSDRKWFKKVDDALSKFNLSKDVRTFLMSNIKPPKDHKHNNSPITFSIPLDLLEASMKDIEDFPFTRDEVFHKKSLFIKARNSDFIKEHAIDDINHFFPNSEIRVFDTGHWGTLKRTRDWDLVEKP